MTFSESTLARFAREVDKYPADQKQSAVIACLAIVAELNGYPGPLHVLELADKLTLSPEQRTRMQGLIHAMKQETIAIGNKVIAAEVVLDRLFAEKRVDAASLAMAMKTVLEAQGRLREAHLRYHLDTRAALTPEQVEGYARLRGYTARP